MSPSYFWYKVLADEEVRKPTRVLAELVFRMAAEQAGVLASAVDLVWIEAIESDAAIVRVPFVDLRVKEYDVNAWIEAPIDARMTIYLRADRPMTAIAGTLGHELRHAGQFAQWGPMRGDWDRAARERQAGEFGDRIARAADGMVASLS